MVMTKRNIQLLRSGAIVLMKRQTGSASAARLSPCPAVGATLCSGVEENFKINVTGQLKEL